VEASKEFLRMLVAVAVAALGYLGAKRNDRNALTGPLPRLRDRQGSAASGGAGAATGVAIGPSVGAAATRLSDKNKAALGEGPRSMACGTATLARRVREGGRKGIPRRP
jgi:hypothetical protein